jgi:exopolyphosphatase/guanosine-5'-triphosphate,3'-diphosphate pyrophosphatase
VARYHRRSLPKPTHDEYMNLPRAQRQTVAKLAAILRLAEALDREHANRVERFKLIMGEKKLVLKLKGQGDLMLEKWALDHNSRLFEKAYKRKIVIEQ